MDPKRQKRLEKAGYEFHDSPAEILGLSLEEMTEVDQMVSEALKQNSMTPPQTPPETHPRREDGMPH